MISDNDYYDYLYQDQEIDELYDFDDYDYDNADTMQEWDNYYHNIADEIVEE